MKHYKTISDYCQGINIAPTKHPHFDLGALMNMNIVHPQMPSFRNEFYVVAIKADGGGKVWSGQFSDFPKGQNNSSMVVSSKRSPVAIATGP